MSIEIWKSIADWATIILIALTVVSGSAALILGDRINEKKTEQSRKFNEDLTAAKTELAKAQKESADAQLALKQYIDAVAKARGPRMLDFKTFVAKLRGKPKANVKIWFAPNDEEAWQLAIQIQRWLGPGVDGDGVNWNVTEPEPIPSEGGDPRVSKYAPPGIKYGALNGLAIIGKEWKPFEEKTAFGALIAAFMACELMPVTEMVPSFPKDSLIIVVGQKR